MPGNTSERLEAAYQKALTALLAERTPEGHWVGELSTSALSTAVAVSALSLVQKNNPSLGRFDSLIEGGLAWLAATQNTDGGWGDTVKSLSNISTTMLGRAAFHITGTQDKHADPLRKSEDWLRQRYGSTVKEWAEAVRARYGKDRTFSVPILMTSALAGLVSWDEVPPLPFELACFPQWMYAALQLPVVSYALPALIAIGQTIFHHRGHWSPIRRWAIQPSLRVLERIQPSNGGFLEATPLTSFVTLGLVSSGQADHVVVRKAVEFLVASVRPDGSWPIDTNLSTWVTTLAINALASAGDLDKIDKRDEVRDWLLWQQFKQEHPYTGAAPGAWAWTPLAGGVPDADDTPGAMLALKALGGGSDVDSALEKGRDWLFDLQNRDGGMPTFCRGWGALPFDRSGCDLTAHALRTFAEDVQVAAENKPQPTFWTLDVPEPLPELEFAGACLEFLKKNQRFDGSWLPLWFGNQYAPDDTNPTYGTARVLAAYRDLNLMHYPEAKRGVAWLLANQNDDGGWGGCKGTPSSVEETSLAVEVLLDAGAEARPAVEKGLAWLIDRVEAGGLHEPTPIGFYFAKLWYFEKLYPIIFAVAALGRARRQHDMARTN